MCIELEQIRKYNSEIVDFIQRHQDAYDIEGMLFVNGEVPNEIALYNIICENKLVGFFMLEFGVENECFEVEMEMGIFDNCQGKGTAYKTIAYFLKHWRFNKQLKSGMRILATIKGENACKDYMGKVLMKNGFKLEVMEENPFDKFIRQNLRHITTEAKIQEEAFLKKMRDDQDVNNIKNITYYIDL